MTNVDQFESMFRSASREVFQYERIEIESVLVVTDRDEGNARLFGNQIRQFLRVVSADEKVRWRPAWEDVCRITSGYLRCTYGRFLASETRYLLGTYSVRTRFQLTTN